jgi:hypothetical protein
MATLNQSILGANANLSCITLDFKIEQKASQRIKKTYICRYIIVSMNNYVCTKTTSDFSVI